jgi:hypothetical protein
MFIASVDKDGLPHMVAARSISAARDGCVTVTYSYCPTTAANLAANRRISVVVWDSLSDKGLQLLGEVEDMRHPKEVSVISGADVQLRVRVERILEFSRRPHADIVLKEQKCTLTAMPTEK